MTEDSNNAVSNSFLLDDDSRLASLNSSLECLCSAFPLCSDSFFSFHLTISNQDNRNKIIL